MVSKTILIVVSEGFGGYGDFLFALKLCQQLKKYYEKITGETLNIYLITQPKGKEAICALKGDVEFGANVLTPKELQQKIEARELVVDHIIEGPVFDNSFLDKIDEALAGLSNTPIPITMIPEYGLNSSGFRKRIKEQERYRTSHCSYIKHSNTIYSGFEKFASEKGILLSDLLIHPPSSEILVSNLDGKIKNYLFNQKSITDFKKNTELYLQYSHDIYEASPSTPVVRFLKIHREFVKATLKNQVVVMIGKSLHHKTQAISYIKDELIQDGFQRITFYNTETQVEEIIYASGSSGKTFLFVYAEKISHQCMVSLIALSEFLIGVTGDQSLSEGLSHLAILVYECLSHKKALKDSFRDALVRESNYDPIILEVLHLLNTAETNDKYNRLGQLLRDPGIRLRLMEANRALVEKIDLVPIVVSEGLNWHLLLNWLVELLKRGKQQEVLGLVKQKNINILTKVQGKSLFEHAHSAEPEGVVVQFFTHLRLAVVHCLDCNDPAEVARFIELSKVNPFITQNGEKSLFSQAIDCDRYDLIVELIKNLKRQEDIELLSHIFQNKNSTDVKYLIQLRKELPEIFRNRNVTKALYFSTLKQLRQYKPMSVAQAEEHHAFHDLLKIFNQIVGEYHEEVLIGFLLLNIGNIKVNFYKTLNNLHRPVLYDLYEELLFDLGIVLKNITVDKAKKYHKELNDIVKNHPLFFDKANLFQLLCNKANISFPYLPAIISIATAKNILKQKSSKVPSNILKTEKSFYCLSPKKMYEGGWGKIYSAQRYSLIKDKIEISPLMAIKRASVWATTSLYKEYEFFEKSYPEKHFALFKKGKCPYLVMPFFSGIPLDEYLVSESNNLSEKDRRLIAIELLKSLQPIHHAGIIHNDLKPKNMLYELGTKKLHIIDFGSAEKVGTGMIYQHITTAKYAIEYMPLEYVIGTNASPANDISSITLCLAEILGVDKKEVVRVRMYKALKEINDPIFRNDIEGAFINFSSLDEALFSEKIAKYHDTMTFYHFIFAFVTVKYDFSPYASKIGESSVCLLNLMQEKNQVYRPSLDQCLNQLQQNKPEILLFKFNLFKEVNGDFNEKQTIIIEPERPN